MDRGKTSDILNLGCGGHPLELAVNHDLTKHSPLVDVAHDLNVTPWPWPDETFSLVIAHDVLEHLASFIAFFDECWRVLRPGGQVNVRTPRWDSLNAVIDPTHVRCYHPESFDYLDPRTAWGKKYGVYYTRRHWQKEMIHSHEGNIIAIMRKVKDETYPA
jgi:SAM-dependent methyltransferase